MAIQEAVSAPILDGPAGPDDGVWARCRPARHRTPLPERGQRVWYRHRRGWPLTDAEVMRIDPPASGDFNVYRFVLDPHTGQPVMVNGERVMELVDDPWPDVVLSTDYGCLATKEARLPESAGYVLKPAV
jgi:hypothetical protein